MSFHKRGCIHKLLSKYCPMMCYTPIYQFDTDIQNNKECWMDPVFLHVEVRHLSLQYTTHSFPAYCLNLLVLFGILPIIMSDAYSFTVLFVDPQKC